MRHSWDYGRAGSYNATSRRCRRCLASGSRFGKGSEPWHGYLPDGRGYDSAAGGMPACPGTPWVRKDDGIQVYWLLTVSFTGKCHVMVTRALVAQFGRSHVEDMIRRSDVPALPPAAWEDLEVHVGNPAG